MPPKAVRTQLKGKTKSDTHSGEGQRKKEEVGVGKAASHPSSLVSQDLVLGTAGARKDGDGSGKANSGPMTGGETLSELDAKALARIEEEFQKLSGATTTGLMDSDPTKMLDAPVAFSQEDLEEIRRYEENLTSWRVDRADQQPDTDGRSDGDSEEDGEEEGEEPSGTSLARPESAHRRLLQQHGAKTTATMRPSSAGRSGGDSSAAVPPAGSVLATVPSVQGLPSREGTGSGVGVVAEKKKTVSSTTNSRSSFGFGTLVKMVLPPEVAHQDSTTVAEALIEVTSARLDDMGMEDTDCLECLTSVVHLHLQRNRITSLSGLDFMLNLQVLLLRGNQIETIADGVLALLPIKVLDLAENNLAGPLGSAVVAYLPFESLTSLCLEDNPCTVRKAKAKDANHPDTLVYRNAVLAKTPFLVALDGVEVSQDEKVLNEMDDPYDDEDGEAGAAESGGAGRGSQGGEGVLGYRVAGGGVDEDAEDAESDAAKIIAKHQDPGFQSAMPKDSDFGLGDQKDDDHSARHRGITIPNAADKADVLPIVEDGEESSSVFQRPHSASTTASKPATPGVTSGGPGEEEGGLRGVRSSNNKTAIAGGVVSRTQQMQSALLKRYMDQVRQKTEATQRSEDYQGEDEGAPPSSITQQPGGETKDQKRQPPSSGDDGRSGSLFPMGSGVSRNRGEESHDKLQQVCGDQQVLRDELRQLGTHHSRVATAQIAELYNNASASLDQRRENAQERRRRSLFDTADVPSAAYERALDLLRKQAGSSDLEQFRKVREDTTTTPLTAGAGGHTKAIEENKE